MLKTVRNCYESTPKNSLIMRLVIFIPLITGMNSVEVPWFTGPIFILPVVADRVDNVFFKIEQLLLFVQILFCFCFVERF